MNDTLMGRARALGLHGLAAHWGEVGERMTGPPRWSPGKRRNGEAAASSAASATPASDSSSRSPTSTGHGRAAATAWPSRIS